MASSRVGSRMRARIGTALAPCAGHRGRFQPLDHRNKKAERLARTGRGGRENVRTIERGRNRLCLNWRRNDKTCAGNAHLQWFGDIEVIEARCVRRLGRNGGSCCGRSLESFRLIESCGSQNVSLWGVEKRQTNAEMPRHHGFQESALLSIIEALLLHGETHPVTGLPARATSASSEGSQDCGGVYIRRITVSGQTPKSTKSLCLRLPALHLSRVHYQCSTNPTCRCV